VARAILELVLSRGARHAEPGEFTKRAFLNGRLDLTQAEAVLDLIRARTKEGSQLALGQVRGELSDWIRDLREELLDLLAQVESAIDFPEEELELLNRKELASRIEGLAAKISRLIASYDWGRLFREGARVCILGRPNVGKSSLLNALLGEDRAIVTAVPGTTRDVIEEGIDLAGLPVVLWDTAGVRAARSAVEVIGVDLTFKYLEQADAAIVVLDGSVPLAEEDKSVLSAVKFRRHLVVINKDDLPQRMDAGALTGDETSFPPLRISAKNGSGLDELRTILRELLLGVATTPDIVLTNIRHKASLERCEQSLKRALDSVNTCLSSELVAVDLQEARDAVEEVVGLVSSDDILAHIFSKFCIGK
jgi:tRNA modification GTPase